MLKLPLKYKFYRRYLLAYLCFFVVLGSAGRILRHEQITYSILAVVFVALCVWQTGWQYFGTNLWRALNAENYKQVIKICEAKLPYADQYSSLYYWLSEAYLRTGEPENALKFSDQFLLEEPKASIGYITSATIKFQLNLVDLAMQDCDRALNLRPFYPEALIIRAYGFSRLKKLREAISDLDEAEKSKLSKAWSALASSNRARVSLIKDDQDKALKYAQQAVKIYPDYSPVLSTRGVVLTRMKMYDAALADLSKAIELEPQRAENYWFRSELYEAMRNYDLAEKDKKFAQAQGYQPYL
jgi:tetratricopeptide (TPR) repeat protein